MDLYDAVRRISMSRPWRAQSSRRTRSFVLHGERRNKLSSVSDPLPPAAPPCAARRTLAVGIRSVNARHTVGGANLLTRRASWRSPSVRTSSSRAGAAGHAPNAIAHGVVVASSETTSPTTFCSCSGRRTSERRWPIDFPPSCVVVAVVSNEAVLSHYGQPADRPGLPGRARAGRGDGRSVYAGRAVAPGTCAAHWCRRPTLGGGDAGWGSVAQDRRRRLLGVGPLVTLPFG